MMCSNPFPNVPATYSSNNGKLYVLIDCVGSIQGGQMDFTDAKVILYTVATGELQRQPVEEFLASIELGKLKLVAGRKYVKTKSK